MGNIIFKSSYKLNIAANGRITLLSIACYVFKREESAWMSSRVGGRVAMMIGRTGFVSCVEGCVGVLSSCPFNSELSLGGGGSKISIMASSPNNFSSMLARHALFFSFPSFV